MPAPLAALLTLALGAMPTPVSDASFQANSARAAKNLATAAGKAYDEALGKSINASADFAPKASACLRQFPGDQTVEGYFEFGADGGYRMVLRPDGGFARCFAQALEGRTVPAPPSRPYVNPFAFSNHPGRPAVKKVVITKDMLRELDGSPLKPSKPAAKPASGATPARKP